MKTLLLACDNDPINLLMSNAVIKPLSRRYKVFVSCEESVKPIFAHNYHMNGFGDRSADKALLVGRGSPDLGAEVAGFWGQDDTNGDAAYTYQQVRNGKVSSNKNLFQLFFAMAGLTWEGQGYDFHYYPRNKQIKRSVGFLIRNFALKEHIAQNVIIGNDKVVDVPFKHNPVKQADEMNRCSQIVTDDEVCLHLALALRKRVEYVIGNEPKHHAVEMFGCGNIHVFNNSLKEEQEHAQGE